MLSILISFSFFLGNLPAIGREAKNKFMHSVICKWYVVAIVALRKVENLVQTVTCFILIVAHFHIFIFEMQNAMFLAFSFAD